MPFFIGFKIGGYGWKVAVQELGKRQTCGSLQIAADVGERKGLQVLEVRVRIGNGSDDKTDKITGGLANYGAAGGTALGDGGAGGANEIRSLAAGRKSVIGGNEKIFALNSQIFNDFVPGQISGRVSSGQDGIIFLKGIGADVDRQRRKTLRKAVATHRPVNKKEGVISLAAFLGLGALVDLVAVSPKPGRGNIEHGRFIERDGGRTFADVAIFIRIVQIICQQ